MSNIPSTSSLSEMELYLMLAEMVGDITNYHGNDISKWAAIFIKQFNNVFNSLPCFAKDLKLSKHISKKIIISALQSDNIAQIYLNLRNLELSPKGYQLFIHYFLYKYYRTKSLYLDFRILNSQNLHILQTTMQLDIIDKILSKVIESNDIHPPKIVHPWIKWNDASYMYKGELLLAYESSVVAINGGIVEKNNLSSPYHVAIHDINCYLLPKFKTPDNIKLNDKQIPLLKLDRDILTGLQLKYLPFFKKRLQQCNVLLLEAPEYEKLILKDLPSSQIAMVSEALNHLRQTRVRVIEFAQQIIKNVRPVTRPKLFITIGGSGSGKGLLKDLALSLCDNNLAEASLDKARYYCDAYKLLVAANHHADDYQIVNQFANALRDKVLNLALESNLNLFFDGSGIPYSGKYSQLVEIFKHSGYEVFVLVADSPFVLPRNKGYNSLPAYQRIINRFNDKNDHRTLPWSVAIQKHIMQPKAQLDAARDCNVDNYYMIDSIMPREKSYVMAETLDIDIRLYELLEQYREDKKFVLNMLSKYSIIDCSTKNFPIKYLPDAQVTIIFLNKINAVKARILLIFNEDRFVQSMEKCLMNPDAEGLEDIFFNTLPFFNGAEK